VLAKLRSKEIDGTQIFMFVCDEADRMISLQGLGDQTMQIKRMLTNKALQVLLFSATFPPSVNKFAEIMAPSAQTIRLKKEQVSLEHVKQFWVATNPGDAKDKYDKLIMLNTLMNFGQSLIFVETVKTAKDLTNQMRASGYTVSVLYGKDLKPAERDAVMRDFVSGKTTVLIATNVASRGIDVPAVNFVVNYELPMIHFGQGFNQTKPDFETYCHRIGRAGRFGRIGAAVNFASSDQEKSTVEQIAKFFDKPITELSFQNFEHLENTIKHHLQLKSN
jgi:ATP-dependent RNA helicase DDX19/DBP5